MLFKQPQLTVPLNKASCQKKRSITVTPPRPPPGKENEGLVVIINDNITTRRPHFGGQNCKLGGYRARAGMTVKKPIIISSQV